MRRRFWFVLPLLLCLASPTFAASITHDASSNSGVKINASSTAGYSHTAGTLNKGIAIIAVSYQDGTGSISGVTYNGVAATQCPTNSPAQFPAGSTRYVSLWYYLSPPSGSSAVVATFSEIMNSHIVSVSTYNNIDQTTPIGTCAKAIDFDTVAASEARVTVTSAIGELVVAIGGFAATTNTPTTSQTSRALVLDSTNHSHCRIEAPGAATVNMSCSDAGGWNNGIIGVSLKPDYSTGWRLDRVSTVAECGSVTSCASSFGTLPLTGAHVFVACAGFNSGGGALTPTVTDNQTGNTYAISVSEYDGASSGYGVWIFKSTAPITSPSGTFTTTCSGFNAGSYMATSAASFVVSGTATLDVSKTARNTTGSTAPDTGAASTTTGTTDLLLTATTTNSTLSSVTEAVTNTVPASGWTNLQTSLGAVAQSLTFSYTIVTSAVAPRYVQTISPSMKWYIVVGAYQQATPLNRPREPILFQ